MSPAEISELYNMMEQLKKENQKLRDDVIVKTAKEKELRDLISYLNKLGPKPFNMEP